MTYSAQKMVEVLAQAVANKVPGTRIAAAAAHLIRDGHIYGIRRVNSGLSSILEISFTVSKQAFDEAVRIKVIDNVKRDLLW
jgi:hypothetical protein